MPQNLQAVRYFEVGPNEAGQRIDNFLLKVLKNVPRSHVYQLLRSGQVRVNKGRIKPAYRLAEGDSVRLPPVYQPEQASQHPPEALCRQLREAVLHEDEDFIVLDKPAGLAVHGGSGLRFGVIEALRCARQDLAFLELGHRLDRGTSGCLALAKNRAALSVLHEGFRTGGHEKIYTALLLGRWQGGARTIDLALQKQQLQGGERMVIADDDGQAATSHFEPQKVWESASLMRVRIETGRMHQIRVHAAELGHPVAGDEKYASRTDFKALRDIGLRRMFLHASSLSLSLVGRRLEVASPLPEALRKVIEKLGSQSEYEAAL